MVSNHISITDFEVLKILSLKETYQKIYNESNTHFWITGSHHHSL